MSDLILKEALNPYKRRLQWRSSLTMLWLTISGGLLLSGILLGLGRIWPLFFQWQLLAIGLLTTLIFTFLGQFYAWFKPLTTGRLARLGDTQLYLDERLTTAFELATGALKTTPELYQAQLDDTLTHLRQTSLAAQAPLIKRKPFLGVLSLISLLSVAVVALYLWPNPLEAVIEEQVQLEELIETEISQLEEVQADLLTEAEALSDPQVEELRETLQELIERLETAQNESSPEQALAALAEAEQTLEAYNAARLEQEAAFNSLADTLAESGFEAAQEAGEALQEGAFDQAGQALQQAGQNPPTSQAEADALADQLDQAAADLAATNPDLAQSLQQAAEALRSANSQALQEALNQAAEQLSQAGEQLAGQPDQQQVAEALQNIQTAREELAQQGTETGQGQGQLGQQGQAQGGQTLLESQGQGGSGREDPTGDAAEGMEAEAGAPGPMSTNNGPNQNRLEDYDSVYAPQHLGGEGGPFAVPDQQGGDGSGLDIGQTPPNPNREAGEATVPYTEVFGEYRDQASTALDNEHIPLGMRDYIRQYFGALEPGQ